MQTTEEVTAILQKDVHITTAVLQRGEATETAKAEASDLREEERHTVLLKDRLKDLHQEDLQEEDRSAAMKAEKAATSDALPREAPADATTAQIIPSSIDASSMTLLVELHPCLEEHVIHKSRVNLFLDGGVLDGLIHFILELEHFFLEFRVSILPVSYIK